MYQGFQLETSGQVLAFVWAIFGICSTSSFVALRFVARFRHRGRLDKTDICIGSAQVFYISLQAVTLVWIFLGGLGLHVDDIVARWGQGPLDIHLKCIWIYLILGMPMGCFAKLSVLSLFETLMPFREVFLATRLLAPGLVLGNIVCILTSIFMCFPVTFFWDHTITGGHCWDLQQYLFGVNLANCLADLICVALPMPFIYRMQLPTRRKLTVMGMFGLGAGACAVAIARQVEFGMLDMSDLTYSVAVPAALMSIEGFVFIAASSIPFLKPLFRSRPKLGDCHIVLASPNNTPSNTLDNMSLPFRSDRTASSSARRGSHNTFAAYGRSFNDLGSFDLETQTLDTESVRPETAGAVPPETARQLHRDLDSDIQDCLRTGGDVGERAVSEQCVATSSGSSA